MKEHHLFQLQYIHCEVNMMHRYKLFQDAIACKRNGVVIPVSFFEEANNAHYNSLGIIDTDGTDHGLYCKSCIPDGPGVGGAIIFSIRLLLQFVGISGSHRPPKLWYFKEQRYCSTPQLLVLNLRMKDFILVIIGSA
ncbi:hypothetical protein Ancab_007557 [Ancistrocladus abbreviatus]